MMELAVYFPNLEKLLAIDEALRTVDTESIPMLLMTTFVPHDPSAQEYIVNLSANSWIQELIRQGCDFSRLYFGQEFCQNLIPPREEVQQAFYFSRQMEWDFTYVTGGYNTEAGIDAISRNLETLHDLEPQAEIVVNDWGVLHVIMRDFPSFRLVLGRLLNKQVRLNLFAGKPHPPFLPQGIEGNLDQVRENQMRAYADVSISNPDYMQELKKWGFHAVDFDMTPQGLHRPAEGWELKLGFYYPWGFIATARNCPTAGTADPLKTFVPTDKPCGKPCQQINCSPNLMHLESTFIQRGPALFTQNDMFNETYAGQLNPPFERLIYEPYIPI